MSLRTLTLLSIIFAFHASAAEVQPKRHQPERQYYTGSIGPIEVFALIDIDPNEPDGISGNYSYRHIARRPEEGLALEGAVQPNGSISMIETASEGRSLLVSGRFQGRTDGGFATINGTWSNRSGTKQLPFSLHAYAREVLLDSTSPKIAGHSLEFLDGTSATAKAAQVAIAEHMRRHAAEARDRNLPLGIRYSVTHYSSSLISIVSEVSFPLGSDQRPESIVIGTKQGVITHLSLADLFRSDSNWLSSLTTWCKKHFSEQTAYDLSLFLPFRIAAFSIVDGQSIELYVEPQPKAASVGVQQVVIPLSQLGNVLSPRCSVSSVLLREKK